MIQWLRIHLPMQGTWVRSLGGEDPLEKGMATHSSILTGKIPWMVEPGGLQSMGVTKWNVTEHARRGTKSDPF